MNGRRRIWVTGVAAATALLLAAFGTVRLVPWVLAEEAPSEKEEQKPEESKGPKPEVKKIPLGEIYTTTAQEGMKWARRRLQGAPADLGTRKQIQALSRYGNIGASNIFLVRGRDFDEAVRATHRVFYGSMGVDTPVLPEQLSKSNPLWLVAYFGLAQSGPQEWQITSVTVEDREVRVRYVRADHYSEESNPSTGDVTGYLFWIRVGELGLGNYALALFDRDQRESVLMRRVAVEDAR